ncbi:MAG: hypothetical protein V1861_04385 [Candidatus Micrarchaeota archaeon]
MDIETWLTNFAQEVYGRFVLLALAPLQNQDMLWAAIPLVIATLFITLYFGRNRREELGWNTAFGNTMVFLFVAISLIREMYRQSGSWNSIFSNELYLLLSIALSSASILLMFITYFHLMPKRVAFFLFSAPPINVTVYVAMSIIYANVAPDILTVLAGVLLIAVIVVAAKIIRAFVRLLGLEDKSDADGQLRIDELAEKVEAELERKRERKKKAPGPINP